MKISSGNYLSIKLLSIELFLAFKKIIIQITGKNVFKRDPQFVRSSYDRQRKTKKELLNTFSFESYIYGAEPFKYSLFDNKLVFGCQKEVHERLIWIISNAITSSNCIKVLELGSGDGKNLFALSNLHPDKKFLGLEFSSESINLSELARNKFSLTNTSFKEIDLISSEKWPSYIEEDTFVFSLMVLEEMPRLYKSVINKLNFSHANYILFLEPMYSFSFKRILLDIARLIRIFNRDRLFGMKSYLKKTLSKNFNIKFIDLGLGNNPINPTYFAYCERKYMDKQK